MLSFEIFVDYFFGDVGQPIDSVFSENRIWPFMPRFEAIFVFTASIIRCLRMIVVICIRVLQLTHEFFFSFIRAMIFFP